MSRRGTHGARLRWTRVFGLVLGLALGLVVWSGCAPDPVSAMAPEGEPRPNVLLIFVDDLGYGQLSAYPQTHPLATPNMDRVAAKGVRMRAGYSADPRCWPSRASLLTGKYHQRFANSMDIPKRHEMISQWLQRDGYATAIFGKWHQGLEDENHPLEWGFDEFFGFIGGLHDYYRSRLSLQQYRERLQRPMATGGWLAAQEFSPIFHGREEVKGFRYLTDEFADRAIAFMQAERPHPFFVYLPFNAAHSPIHMPRHLKEAYAGVPNSRARAMVQALDMAIGRVLDALEQSGLAQSTAVFLISDNGSPIHRGTPGANGVLRGEKMGFAEGGIRVPFLVSWPGHLPMGAVYDEPVSTLDVAPTIAAMTGTKLPDGAVLNGVDLLSHWRGESASPPHEVLFWGNPAFPRYAVRRGRWKLLHDTDEGESELFDLLADESESRNLSEQAPEQVRELQALYEAWRLEVLADRDPGPEPTPDGVDERG